MGNGKQFFTRMAFLLVLFVGLLMPLSVNGDNVYLPLTLKCGGCENLLGAWRIQTPTEIHIITFLPNGSFNIILLGEQFVGNYSCTRNHFEGFTTKETAIATVSLQFLGEIACSGISMSGIFETKVNGIVDQSGNFTGQKL